MKVLDLFSGVGMFSLGLQRAGFETVAFVEISPWCRKILARHWPTARVYNDVRHITQERLATDGVSFAVICGGFPCQDISVAGYGEGLAGARSGLWWDFARIIAETAPEWVIIENVPALRSRGLDSVLGCLASIGYDASWDCIPASAVGAPHRRDRVWLVAHATGGRSRCDGQGPVPVIGGGVAELANADGIGCHGRGGEWNKAGWRNPADGGQALGNPDGGLLAFWSRFRNHLGEELASFKRTGGGSGLWFAEPAVGRVADGVADRVDRLRALGNGLVPQIPEAIGRAIVAMQSGIIA